MASPKTRRGPRKKRAPGPRNAAARTAANSSKGGKGCEKAVRPDIGSNVEKRLERYLECKGEERSDYRLRRRTVTTSVYATLRGFIPIIYAAVVEAFERESIGLGIVRSHLSIFLVDIIEKSETEEDDRKLLASMCQQYFYRNLMIRLAGKAMDVTSDIGFNNYLEHYIGNRSISVGNLALTQALNSRIIEHAANEYFTSFKNNILLNYEARFQRMFYDWYRPGLEGEIKNGVVRALAERAYQLCDTLDNQLIIAQRLDEFIETRVAEVMDHHKEMNQEAVSRFFAVAHGSTLPEDASAMNKLKHYFPRMKKVRELASSLAVAGYRPKLFTLVPICRGVRSFITLDVQTGLAMLRKAEKICGMEIDRRLGQTGKIGWVNLLFDLYGKTRNHWTETCRPDQSSTVHKRKKGDYKVLKKGQDKRQGLHQLRPFFWAIATRLTDDQLRKKNKMPIIPKIIRTNGLEVQVLLMTLEKVGPDDDGPEGFVQRSFRSKGVDALSLAGYRSLTRVLDINRDRFGVYGDVKLEENVDVLKSIRLFGVDPGQKEIFVVSGEDFSENAFEVANDGRTSRYEVSATLYKRNALMTNALKTELKRRRHDQGYNDLIVGLNAGTLKDPALVQTYVDTHRNNFDNIVEKFIKYDGRKQRMARSRANRRTFDRLGKRITHHRELKALSKRWLPSKEYRRELKKVMEAASERKSFISWGRPTFKSGIYGPTPLKKTIRYAAKWNNVYVTNEFRTTKMCHVCKSVTEDGEYRERVCTNPLCGITLGRDVNGSMNTGQIGRSKISKGCRPDHLGPHLF